MTVTSRAGAAIDRDRIAALTKRQQEIFAERTQRSGEFFERARAVLPGGVPSQFQLNDPWPVYLERGEGASVWDVDGNRYIDFHNGFGVMCVGHANPAITAAVRDRVGKGTHFAAPTEGGIVVAEELKRRWKLPHWRFTNSGTESTMDAVHIARAITGRELLIKIEGAYHGHHDAVMVSVHPPNVEVIGDRSSPIPVPYSEGLLRSAVEDVRTVPFNDLEFVERVLDQNEGKVAGLIMEPAMMNCNIVKPIPGYLEGVRSLTREHGVQLIFDEVKTGAAIAPGGATEYFGVQPDMVALAKAICGGLPGGAIGMGDEAAELVASGRVKQQGTFNGNPLTMAAAEACLLEVLTDEAYAKLDRDNERLMGELDKLIARYGLAAYTVGMGSKGCVVFSPGEVREYRDYLTKVDHELIELAWLYHMNNGVYMTPGVDEEWTLSVMHGDEDLDRYLAAFEQFAKDVTGA